MGGINGAELFCEFVRSIILLLVAVPVVVVVGNVVVVVVAEEDCFWEDKGRLKRLEVFLFFLACLINSYPQYPAVVSSHVS